eukprot:TRINITY_DN9255_c0_g1_i1.p1 TRINITY_DN9255_c0_g1~~TRINITY_DN9255_c0_g1_i1.p1  ORF type:complete len:823 (+),score=84.09 TRINITY_DN9255_c0_g1_i1:53-2521(+)
MDQPPDIVRGFSFLLKQSLSLDSASRKTAEDAIFQLVGRPGTYKLCHSIMMDATQDEQVRLSAAVLFKNLTKKSISQEGHWIATLEDLEILKSNLFSSYLRCPKTIKNCIMSIFVMIGESGFLQKWFEIIPELCQRMQADNQPFKVAALEISNAIFKRYRLLPYSKAMEVETMHVFEHFQEALLCTTQSFFVSIANGNDPEMVWVGMNILRMCISIYHSFCCQRFINFHPPTYPYLIDMLLKILQTNPSPDMRVQEAQSKLILKVLKCAGYLLENTPEGITNIHRPLSLAVYKILTDFPSFNNNEQVVIGCVVILQVCSLSPDFPFVESPQALQALFERVILQNIALTNSDLECFELNPHEYVRKDMEGWDVGTRRRASLELVKTLCSRIPQILVPLTLQQVVAMLQIYQQNPASQWRLKNVSIQLVTGLHCYAADHSDYSVVLNSFVRDFLERHVLGEIQNPAENCPIIKADCLKFLFDMRKQIPKEFVYVIMNYSVEMIRSDYDVIRIYSCILLEHLLTNKSLKTRVASQDVAGLAPRFFDHIFHWICSTSDQENIHPLKCLLRFINFLRFDLHDQILAAVGRLLPLMASICQNWSHSEYGHYLFEITASLVKYCNYQNSEVRDSVLQAMATLCTMSINSQSPEPSIYAIQLVSQLIDSQPGKIPPFLRSYIPQVINTNICLTQGRKIASLLVIRAILLKDPEYLASETISGSIVRVLSLCSQSKLTALHAMDLVSVIFERLSSELLESLAQPLIAFLMSCVLSIQAPCTARRLLQSLCSFSGAHGGSVLAKHLEIVTPGYFPLVPISFAYLICITIISS